MIKTIKSLVISHQINEAKQSLTFTKAAETDGAKRFLDRKFSIRDQILFFFKLKKEWFAEGLLLRVGLPVVHGRTTMQLLYSISTTNSLLPVMITRFTLSMMVSCLVVMYWKLEAINSMQMAKDKVMGRVTITITKVMWLESSTSLAWS